MILLLIDLYKMENTFACLNIIKIEPNFRSLLYHDSIIKTSCSREQYTSHMRTDIFIELKKEIKVIKLWYFDKVLRNVFWRPQGSLLLIFWFLCSVVWPIYRRARLFSMMMVRFKGNSRFLALGCKNSLTIFCYTFCTEFGMGIIQ